MGRFWVGAFDALTGGRASQREKAEWVGRLRDLDAVLASIRDDVGGEQMSELHAARAQFRESLERLHTDGGDSKKGVLSALQRMTRLIQDAQQKAGSVAVTQALKAVSELTKYVHTMGR